VAQNNTKVSIPLKAVIRSIQNQLIESEKEREEMNLPGIFSVKEIEIEMSFVVEKSISAEAQANIVIVDAEGSVNYRKEEINRIKLTLSTDSNTNAFEQILGGGARPSLK